MNYIPVLSAESRQVNVTKIIRVSQFRRSLGGYMYELNWMYVNGHFSTVQVIEELILERRHWSTHNITKK